MCVHTSKSVSSVFSLTMLYICTCSVHVYPHLLHITVTAGILYITIHDSIHIGTSVDGTVYINVR